VIVLLDTHALIWAIEDSPRLSRTARAVIEDGANVVLASATSGWEIAIKTALGKLSAPDDLEAALESAGFTKRMITFADTRRLTTLPPHHHDPFDRMLVAQALEDGVPVVSCDPQMARYPVQIIW
jgi:PIN domain nuclease of toxin-antitoxin system